jgi:hypothetical protein
MVTVTLPLPTAPTPTVSSSISPGRSDTTFRPIEVITKPAVCSDKIDPNTGLRRVLITDVHAFPFHGKLDVRQRRIGDDLRKVFDEIQPMGDGRFAVLLRGGPEMRGVS